MSTAGIPKGDNAKPAITAPGVGDGRTSLGKELDAFFGPNAYLNAAGSVLQVLSKLSESEIQIQEQMAEERNAVTAAQTAGTKIEADSMRDGAIADGVRAGGSIASGAGTAGHAYRSGSNYNKLNTDHDKKINDKHEEIAKHRSQMGVGTLPADHAKNLTQLEHEKTQLESGKQAALRSHDMSHEGMRMVPGLLEHVSGIGSTVGKAQADSAGVGGRNAQALAQQQLGDIQSNQKGAVDVANEATRLISSMASAAVAAARG